MKYRKALVLCPLLALIPSAAFAHALFVSPKPRDNVDGWKEFRTKGFVQPCGVARKSGQPVTVLKTGSTVSLSWNETVNHPGCFLVDFSEDEKTFKELANFKHVNKPAITVAAPRPYMTSVTLPAGVKCDGCILRLRQVMLGTEAAVCPPPGGIDPNDLYYSCANIVISDNGPDGGAAPDPGRTDAAAVARDMGAGAGAGDTGGSAGVGGTTGTGGTNPGPTTGTGGSPTSPGGQGGAPAMGRGGSTGTSPVAADGGSTAGATEAPASKNKGSSGCALGGKASGLDVLGLGLLATIVFRRRRRA